MADSKGTNHGDYFSGLALGVTGAIARGLRHRGHRSTASTTTPPCPARCPTTCPIEFWFKSTQGIGTDRPVAAGRRAGRRQRQRARTTTSGSRCAPTASGLAGVGSPDADDHLGPSGGYDDGAWHHVVFTRATSGAIKLYVDGGAAVIGHRQHGCPRRPAPNINFGRIASGTNYYAGTLDEIAIYNAVLSAATVTAHYNAR